MECVLPSQQQILETHDETVEVSAGCVSLRGKHDQFTVRKIASALRLTYSQADYSDWRSHVRNHRSRRHTKKPLKVTKGEGFGSMRANHEQLTVRKIFKINRKLLHPPRQ